MGDYADDLINGSILSDGFEEDLELEEEFVSNDSDCFGNSNKSLKKEYEVRILHRQTMVTYWIGTITANSKKDAQRKFRKDYPEVRSQYSHEYALGIKLKRNKH